VLFTQAFMVYQREPACSLKSGWLKSSRPISTYKTWGQSQRRKMYDITWRGVDASPCMNFDCKMLDDERRHDPSITFSQSQMYLVREYSITTPDSWLLQRPPCHPQKSLQVIQGSPSKLWQWRGEKKTAGLSRMSPSTFFGDCEPNDDGTRKTSQRG